MEKYFRVGVIANTHGIRGEVKVYPTTDDINRFKKLEISKAGGCNFVNRPINYHLDLLKNFGVDYLEKEDNYYFDYHENDIEEYTSPKI